MRSDLGPNLEIYGLISQLGTLVNLLVISLRPQSGLIKELFHILVLPDHTVIQIKLLHSWCILQFSFSNLSHLKNALCQMDVICLL